MTIGLVAQNPVTTFTSPANGDSLDATVVKGNDNTLKTAHNAHDADPSIHVQSATLASRPAAAANAQGLFISTDGRRAYLSDGAAWNELAYLPSVGGTLSGALTISSGGASIAGGLTVTGGNITGTIGTAAQPNITSLGTLTSLSVSGSITGTLGTAAQPNVTSLGTLTGLTVSGTLNANGTLALGSKVLGPFTGFTLRNNADSADNLAVSDAGDVTVRGKIDVTKRATSGRALITSSGTVVLDTSLYNYAEIVVTGAGLTLQTSNPPAGIGQLLTLHVDNSTAAITFDATYFKTTGALGTVAGSGKYRSIQFSYINGFWREVARSTGDV